MLTLVVTDPESDSYSFWFLPRISFLQSYFWTVEENNTDNSLFSPALQRGKALHSWLQSEAQCWSFPSFLYNIQTPIESQGQDLYLLSPGTAALMPSALFGLTGKRTQSRGFISPEDVLGFSGQHSAVSSCSIRASHSTNSQLKRWENEKLRQASENREVSEEGVLRRGECLMLGQMDLPYRRDREGGTRNRAPPDPSGGRRPRSRGFLRTKTHLGFCFCTCCVQPPREYSCIHTLRL